MVLEETDEWRIEMVSSLALSRPHIRARVFVADTLSGREITCTIFQAPADTCLMPNKQLFESSVHVNDADGDFLSLTYQIPAQTAKPGKKRE